MALINSDCSRPINLGSGVMRSVHDVCNILSNLSGYEIKDLEKEVSGHYEYCHDLSLVKSITDWTPKYSLELGLEKTYKIMSEMNYE
jgi:nucleoside-diphosphate-sugar epimerase